MMSNTFNFDKKIIFGWVVHVKTILAGETYTAKVLGDDVVSTTKTGNITLWTEGHIKGINLVTNEEVTPRTKGYFSLDRDFIPVGEFQFTAMEDSEWVCINYTANRRALPIVSVLRTTSEGYLLPANSYAFFCSHGFSANGKIYNKFDYDIFESETFIANNNAGLIMLFEGNRNAAS